LSAVRCQRVSLNYKPQTQNHGQSRSSGGGVDLISDALPFGHLWSDEPDAATTVIDYLHSCTAIGYLNPVRLNP
jgi:hypothetical protein